jgi:hypothetical protein
MKINLISPDIYEIENFISVEEQENVLDYCKSLDESEWWTNDPKASEFFNGKIKLGDKPDFFLDIDEKIKHLFFGIHKIYPIGLNRHLETNFMKPHRDYDRLNNTLPDEHIRYGIVLYYNDNYDGGAVNYPEVGIVHKPKARSLLIHGGRILHGTTKVLSSDVRYFSTTFVFGTKEKSVSLNKSMFGDIEQSDGYKYSI